MLCLRTKPQTLLALSKKQLLVPPITGIKQAERLRSYPLTPFRLIVFFLPLDQISQLLPEKFLRIFRYREHTSCCLL